MGYCGSFGSDRCLRAFLGMALFSLGLQASFVLSMHLNFEMVLTALENGEKDTRLEKTLSVGKWIFVGILAGMQ